MAVPLAPRRLATGGDNGSRGYRSVDRAGARRWLGGGLAFLLLVVGVGAAVQWSARVGADAEGTLLTHRVTRGELKITVTEEGNVESAGNKDIRCEVAGGSTILRIVTDGTLVQKGDELVRLDSSLLEDQATQQRVLVERARATLIQAQQDFRVATVAIREYLDGVYKQALQACETQITVALENLRSAENACEHAGRMARKGYITALQLAAQEFAVERAKLDLATAETAKTVLEDFTKPKTLEGLQATRDATEARLRSEQAACELEQRRLERLHTQLEKCVIRAPQDGMVIYYKDMSRRRDNSLSEIEEGVAVREQQIILRLPDLSDLQVRVAVHESKVESVKPGMPARIRIQDRAFEGKVVSLANQPERESWFSANVKEYAVIVKVDGDVEGLRPGMTAEVEILVAHLQDVVTVPVQAVVEQGGKFFCWVKGSGAPERRPVVLGASNDKFIEIKDGLLEGEYVLLNPRATVSEAREEA